MCSGFAPAIAALIAIFSIVAIPNPGGISHITSSGERDVPDNNSSTFSLVAGNPGNPSEISLSNKSAKQQEVLENLKVENKGQSETLENMEGMIIKLINRWNTSDDKLDRKFDALTKDVNSVDNQISEVKGSLSRINGRH